MKIYPRRLIGEAMVEEQLITTKQLEEALRHQSKIFIKPSHSPDRKKLIGEILIELGYLKEGNFLDFLAGFFCDYEMSPRGKKIRIIDDIEELPAPDLKKWLTFMVKKGASDLHLIAGLSPRLRIHGELMSTKVRPLSSEKIKSLIYGVLTSNEIKTFEQNKALDKSFEVKDVSRYRVNLHWQRDSVSASIRALPIKIPGFEDLGIPDILKDFASRPGGLVLITGPACCGKSTTLAAMVEFINITRSVNIITIEDPIEYTFVSKNSLIRQRELGKDTFSFSEALKSMVRQDPNVILIGEMRDLDTVQAALTLAETGHLVFSTLHTQDAVHSINRIVDVFPLTHQHEVRIKLSMVLEGVAVQQLIPRIDTSGRVLACEILNCTSSIKNLIRENNLSQIHSYIQMGKQHGMISMNQSLLNLYKRGIVSWDDVWSRSNDRDEILRLMPDSALK